MAKASHHYMPMQLLNEAKEYMKVLELIQRYFKQGSGNIYIRKGADALMVSKNQSGKSAVGGNASIQASLKSK
jgi:hypothetical protein